MKIKEFGKLEKQEIGRTSSFQLLHFYTTPIFQFSILPNTDKIIII